MKFKLTFLRNLKSYWKIMKEEKEFEFQRTLPHFPFLNDFMNDPIS